MRAEHDAALAELAAAAGEASRTLAAWRDAKIRWAKAREVCGEAGILPCEGHRCLVPGAKATHRYRCGRWYCSKECHDDAC